MLLSYHASPQILGLSDLWDDSFTRTYALALDIAGKTQASASEQHRFRRGVSTPTARGKSGLHIYPISLSPCATSEAMSTVKLTKTPCFIYHYCSTTRCPSSLRLATRPRTFPVLPNISLGRHVCHITPAGSKPVQGGRDGNREAASGSKAAGNAE